MRHFLTLAALLSFNLFAQDFAYDTSGEPGRSGHSASSGGGYSASGSAAGQPSAGGHAKAVRLRIRSVEGAPGLATLEFAGGPSRQVNLSQIGRLLLQANGGDGGHGGNGGDGSAGRDGDNGRDCGVWSLWPTSGENGGNGGNGGPGTSGADGGDAGDIEVEVDEEDAHLLAKLAFEAKGGNGGQAGRHGTGGQGGRGGSAGATSYYDWNEGEYKHCFAFVTNGSNGSNGYTPGDHLASGRPGRDGEVSVRVRQADGSVREYADIYKLVVDSARFQEEFQNGVIEPGEKLKLLSLGLRNEGKMLSPGHVSLEILDLAPGLQANDPSQTLGLQRSLAPNEGTVLDLSQQNLYYVANTSVTSGTAEATLGGMKLSLPRRFELKVSNSVDLSSPARFTLGYPSTELRFSLSNTSNQKRNAQVKVTFVPGSGGQFLTLEKSELSLELPAQSTHGLGIQATPTQGARFGAQGTLTIELLVNDLRSGEMKVVSRETKAIGYEPPKGIESLNLTQRLGDQNLEVTFQNGSKRSLRRLWITKDSGMITVQYELSYFHRNSPVYRFSMEEMAPLLGAFPRGSLTRAEILTLFNNYVKGKSSDSWALGSIK
jgi:hypothetical protein